MTPFEWLVRAAWPGLSVLHREVHACVRNLLAEGRSDERPSVLDVGGRTSLCTVGLPARVTIVDLPRASEVQHDLRLGLLPEHLSQLKARRSNIETIRLEDMAESTLPDAAYQGVISVEVIEHVPQDGRFLDQIHRVLSPGGWVCLTTPNGDYVRNEGPDANPDHLRHYTKQELHDLLAARFDAVEVRYTCPTGWLRRKAVRGVTIRRPIRSVMTMIANVAYGVQSQWVGDRRLRTAHLLAIARKAH